MPPCFRCMPDLLCGGRGGRSDASNRHTEHGLRRATDMANMSFEQKQEPNRLAMRHYFKERDHVPN